jgi:hypothetical protein
MQPEWHRLTDTLQAASEATEQTLRRRNQSLCISAETAPEVPRKEDSCVDVSGTQKRRGDEPEPRHELRHRQKRCAKALENARVFHTLVSTESDIRTSAFITRRPYLRHTVTHIQSAVRAAMTAAPRTCQNEIRPVATVDPASRGTGAAGTGVPSCVTRTLMKMGPGIPSRRCGRWRICQLCNSCRRRLRVTPARCGSHARAILLHKRWPPACVALCSDLRRVGVSIFLRQAQAECAKRL